MKVTTQSAALAILAAVSVDAAPAPELLRRDEVNFDHPRLVARDVYTNYPYTGPAM